MAQQTNQHMKFFLSLSILTQAFCSIFGLKHASMSVKWIVSSCLTCFEACWAITFFSHSLTNLKFSRHFLWWFLLILICIHIYKCIHIYIYSLCYCWFCSRQVPELAFASVYLELRPVQVRCSSWNDSKSPFRNPDATEEAGHSHLLAIVMHVPEYWSLLCHRNGEAWLCPCCSSQQGLQPMLIRFHQKCNYRFLPPV